VSSYLGYTDFDIAATATLLRRLYKEPENMPMEELLDFLVVLALSDSYYKQYEEKTKKFVEQALELVEEEFQGTLTANVKIRNEQNKLEDFEFKYFKSVQTDDKLYNKTLIPVELKQNEDNYLEDMDAEKQQKEEEEMEARKAKEAALSHSKEEEAVSMQDLPNLSEDEEDIDEETELQKLTRVVNQAKKTL